ncbi:MAG: BolA/IbaG family iron-sulfur metabolism protein [Chlamydiia bacterium]|nr:BolA/IbaG family iron-sulfur metabolism protein [Chlamydiia bacterium]
MELFQEIAETIRAAVDADAEVHILDPRQDGVHLEALVISQSFDGLSLVKQQQVVMKALKEHFATSLHALGLRTFTPAKWHEQKSKFGF